MKSKNLVIIILIMLTSSFIMFPSEKVRADPYQPSDFAYAILANQSTFVSAQYSDSDTQNRQGIILSSLGTMLPTHGSDFIVLSTGIAGAVPVMTESGDYYHTERGTWFNSRIPGGSGPFDKVTLTLDLHVPPHVHYVYYDVKFFTTEYPDYIGTIYNDQLTITVDSPGQGISQHIINVNGGDFVLNAHDIPNTGFDIFAKTHTPPHNPTNPSDVDWIDRIPAQGSADAGATALVGREHPVSPDEIITVTIDLRDAGDNQFDSAAFIDNLKFSGYAITDIIARKTVEDLNGGDHEPEDTLEYSITISNIGAADQSNNPGNEFEDLIPENTEYVPGSAYASSGTISYDSMENKIKWDGGIPGESSVALNFQVTINSGLANGVEISNQGTVYWDSNENGTNDATELTDDPAVDDGIDQDGDGETDDDDPTTIVVSSYEPPSTVTEDFSDDEAGGKATQSYEEYIWFETSETSVESNFEVASDYHYSTPKSFKTKLRSPSSIQYWNYSLSHLNSEVKWWEVWFACGNTSDESDLYLNFKDSSGSNVARIKFEYVKTGSDPPSYYVAKLYYLAPGGWSQLSSDFSGGYLYNSWYKLRIEKNGTENIDYSLQRAGKGQVDFATDERPGNPFSDLVRVEWSSTKNPIVCPLFFWDEHSLGLTIIS